MRALMKKGGRGFGRESRRAQGACTLGVHTQPERSASTAAEFLMIPMLIGTCSTREILEPGDTGMRDELRVGMRLDLL